MKRCADCSGLLGHRMAYCDRCKHCSWLKNYRRETYEGMERLSNLGGRFSENDYSPLIALREIDFLRKKLGIEEKES